MSEAVEAKSSTASSRRAFVVIAVLVVATLAIVLYLRSQRTPSGLYSGTVEVREMQVGSKIGGRVTQVAVDDGARVQPGDLLVRFEADQLTAERAQAVAQAAQAAAALAKMQRGFRPEEIEQAQANAAQQQAMLAEAKNGPRQQEILEARANYASAQADAHDAQVTYDRMAMLVRGETVSRQQYDDAKAKRDATAQQAEAARQRLLLLEAGTRHEDIEAAQQRYAQAAAQARLTELGNRREDIDAAKAALVAAQAQVTALDAQLREAALYAPATGAIETVSIRPGDLVPPGQIVMTLLEDSELWVKIYVPETDLASLKLNQHATITTDAASGHTFAAHVEEIASQAEFLPRNVETKDDRAHEVFAVKVRVEQPAGLLKSGMAATVHLQ
ncbi:HlyD family secretion protein/HlyD family secretion protein [Bryocella elongata]|uniref:HlyD family secretion protein/HlyD family secretion protein n=1 Tax=Bryocella elongata TaxID=863522 RepID=A0A1H5YIM6_9BACT|nr:efflux RND transporter periplasmic adaptor subunit [Bryocella elongata]SEG23999.1 HlyD family secretion protein/HlyD family secretion protein [Bryocella elongata]